MAHEVSRTFSLAQSSEQEDESRTFDKQLPRDIEYVRVQVQRGAVVRRQRDPTTHVRTYDIMVEPGGHARRQKDLIREAGQVPAHHVDWDSEVKGTSEHSELEQVGERFSFRRERARRFKVGSHFPALVASPRIVPAWPSLESGQASSSRTSPSHGGGGSPRSVREVPTRQLTKPTISNTAKHTAKHQEGPLTRHWATTGPASELLSDRRPALYDEHYEAAMDQQRKEYMEAKGRWVGEATILPATHASCLDTRGRAVRSHIAAQRRSSTSSESLQERYEVSRKHFQMQRQERSGRSRFERHLEAAKERAADEEETMTARELPEAKLAGFKCLADLKRS